MHSVTDIIEAFGGPTAFARVIERRPSTASEMKRNHSIPVRHWPKVIAAAKRKGITGLNADRLMEIHARGHGA